MFTDLHPGFSHIHASCNVLSEKRKPQIFSKIKYILIYIFFREMSDLFYEPISVVGKFTPFQDLQKIKLTKHFIKAKSHGGTVPRTNEI